MESLSQGFNDEVNKKCQCQWLFDQESGLGLTIPGTLLSINKVNAVEDKRSHFQVYRRNQKSHDDIKKRNVKRVRWRGRKYCLL